jgi:alkylhydroperoxidase/carboxymuconolactone decarboxylase family protein YurZ
MKKRLLMVLAVLALFGCMRPMDQGAVRKMVDACMDAGNSPKLLHNLDGTVYQVECRSMRGN